MKVRHENPCLVLSCLVLSLVLLPLFSYCFPQRSPVRSLIRHLFPKYHFPSSLPLTHPLIPIPMSSSTSLPRELLLISRRPPNSLCADCRLPGPTWASFNLGVFICMNCSGVHRQMGTHISRVRSIDLDKWDEQSVALMAQIGNVTANSFFECKLPPNSSHRITPNASDSQRADFIRNKYERRIWFGEPNLNKSDGENGSGSGQHEMTKAERRALRMKAKAEAMETDTHSSSVPTTITVGNVQPIPSTHLIHSHSMVTMHSAPSLQPSPSASSSAPKVSAASVAASLMASSHRPSPSPSHISLPPNSLIRSVSHPSSHSHNGAKSNGEVPNLFSGLSVAVTSHPSSAIPVDSPKSPSASEVQKNPRVHSSSPWVTKDDFLQPPSASSSSPSPSPSPPPSLPAGREQAHVRAASHNILNQLSNVPSATSSSVASASAVSLFDILNENNNFTSPSPSPISVPSPSSSPPNDLFSGLSIATIPASVSPSFSASDFYSQIASQIPSNGDKSNYSTLPSSSSAKSSFGFFDSDPLTSNGNIHVSGHVADDSLSSPSSFSFLDSSSSSSLSPPPSSEISVSKSSVKSSASVDLFADIELPNSKSAAAPLPPLSQPNLITSPSSSTPSSSSAAFGMSPHQQSPSPSPSPSTSSPFFPNGGNSSFPSISPSPSLPNDNNQNNLLAQWQALQQQQQQILFRMQQQMGNSNGMGGQGQGQGMGMGMMPNNNMMGMMGMGGGQNNNSNGIMNPNMSMNNGIPLTYGASSSSPFFSATATSPSPSSSPFPLDSLSSPSNSPSSSTLSSSSTLTSSPSPSPPSIFDQFNPLHPPVSVKMFPSQPTALPIVANRNENIDKMFAAIASPKTMGNNNNDTLAIHSSSFTDTSSLPSASSSTSSSSSSSSASSASPSPSPSPSSAFYVESEDAFGAESEAESAFGFM